MKKQGLTSASHSEFTLDALRQIAPSAFTEVRGADGELTQKVDFDVLRELLGDAILDGDEDRFGFYWIGKQEAKRAAAEPIRQTLRPVVEDSVDWDTTENLYIEGDNLEVLKLLQRAYLGKVKMIYIDPPYNTGNDFVYDDSFAMNSEELDEAMGNIDEEGNRLRRNLDSSPRYHSDWCSMIYSRLLVARTLLANDGVIFISIDDNEVHHLRKICDEVFGASNFVAEFVWEKTVHFGRQKKNTYSNKEYVLCYAKQAYEREGLKTLLVERIKTNLMDAPLYNQSNPEKTINFAQGTVQFNIPDGIYTMTTNEKFKIISPINVVNGVNQEPFSLRFKSRWSNETISKEVSNGVRYIVKSTDFSVRALYPESRGSIESPKELIFTNPNNPLVAKSRFGDKVGTTEEATSQLVKLFDEYSKIFDYPKPTSLIKYLISLLWSGDGFLDEFYILDFFSGSATTAHAVMQLNAEDGGNRKYIMVQIPEETPEKSEARNAGYDTICEIGKERIRRAGKMIKEDPENKDKKIDTGFRVLRVDSSNMEDVYFEPAGLRQENLFTHVDSVKQGRTELDLLFGCMVDWGVELSYPLRREEVAGKHLHIVNEGALVACFDKDISVEVVRHIAEMRPLRIIFREECFATDANKLNIYEQFKQLSGWSDDEAYKRIHVI